MLKIILAVVFCMNPVTQAGNKAVKRVKKAEQLLTKGKYEKAAETVWRRKYKFDDPELQARAELVYATAALRLRRDQDWALETLQRMHDEQPDAPVVQARLAEAEAQIGELSIARELMQDLVDRDLVPDAWGWATAALSLDSKEAREAATARCEEIAKDDSICPAVL